MFVDIVLPQQIAPFGGNAILLEVFREWERRTDFDRRPRSRCGGPGRISSRVRAKLAASENHAMDASAHILLF
jgi:hypothetical protein